MNPAGVTTEEDHHQDHHSAVVTHEVGDDQVEMPGGGGQHRELPDAAAAAGPRSAVTPTGRRGPGNQFPVWPPPPGWRYTAIDCTIAIEECGGFEHDPTQGTYDRTAVISPGITIDNKDNNKKSG